MGSIYRRGDIVQVSWPHSDGGEKSRPTLVLSTEAYNADRLDLMLVKLSTKSSLGAIALAGPDRRGTKLVADGFVHPHALNTIGQDRVERKLGRIPIHILRQVESTIREYLDL